MSSQSAATLVNMKTKQTLAALLLACASIQFASASETNAAADTTLSPYFHVKTGEGGGGDAMPLKSTDVQVKIVGVMADVSVTQT